MKSNRIVLRFFMLLFSTLFFPDGLEAQLYPVSFSERVEGSEFIVIGKVLEKTAYRDASNSNIYTLNILEVTALLKGSIHAKQIGLISSGGILDHKMEINYPGIQLSEGEELLVLLDKDEQLLDNRLLRLKRPELFQCRSSFGVQGVLKFQNGYYHDMLSGVLMTEGELLELLEDLTRKKAQRPDGQIYRPRVAKENMDLPKILLSLDNGAGSAPSGFIAGTIGPDNELVITGSGFGSTTGSVVFLDANHGGSTEFIVPANTIASDIVSWTDTKVRVKIPDEAGTGSVEIRDASGLSKGSAPIVINYSVKNVSSNFYLWPTDQRNRIELVDMNNQGGYTFKFNNNAPAPGSSFFANDPAMQAFARSVENWRCNTLVNWDVDFTGTSEGHAGDNGSIILFQNLSGGTLGITTSRYAASANTGCSMEDTFWYLEEIDMRFDNSLSGGYSWNFGPGASNNFQFDFESVALHELGHGHGMAHIIAPGKVMNFLLNAGTDIRNLSPEDISAGLFKMSHSIQENCIPAPGAMSAIDPANCAVLPIQLEDFEAKLVKKEVLLTWTTASETGNAFFAIERSSDGKHFMLLNTMAGAGNAIDVNEYHYLDQKPLSGTSYYRLKQTDVNGIYSYSPVKVIQLDTVSPEIRIFPNPVSGGQIEVLYYDPEDPVFSIQLYDVTGKLIRIVHRAPEDKQEKTVVPVNDFPSGIYFIKFGIHSGKVISRPFIVK